ncbi:PEP-CTERM sorting domain-containing protein [Colwellia hornerae]|uniref:PEP-CTERM sorting domain-containing protein n=1 Tax=Colwellia hornerae TaxID=89402 RepID=A0A5C6QN80_9GAMM|nr:PEP-CTERM sorting domain-containing protein [Colwellia hornerae]TWX53654.1 PEP-CTERM sorting domain-containing protein [Colwellia hornerae]TWX60305.1 PEP-CTERM sorting domain-containing protein [Colwellia hornerae]TWX70060.1 PEP-CTERM sorting domain-containing protein [Colwellia hornerae]
MKLKFIKTALISLLFSTGCFINVANAGLIALDSTRGTGNQGYGGSLAMYFDVTSAINVTELGAFDSGFDGFDSEIQVGIFDRNTNLMVTEIATFLGTSNTLMGNSRFFNIADVTLGVGSYAIVARGFNDTDKNGNAGPSGTAAPTINNGSGLIQFVGGGYYGGNSINDFALTTDSGTPNRYDAGTFIYTKVTEPSTLAIFGLALVGLASRRFKKQS